MKKLVLKFGGTSVGSIEKIKSVANIIKKRHEENNEIIVIVITALLWKLAVTSLVLLTNSILSSMLFPANG